MTVSLRSRKVSPSQTLSISALSNQLLAQKKDVINLAAGQPAFATPDHIKHAAIEAINNNMTRYTAVDGTAELKQAVCDKFKRENGLSYTSDQIIVSGGAKFSLYLLCQAVLDKGDEVIIPAPFWTTYPEVVKLADAAPATIATNAAQGFKITANQLEGLITSSTKVLMLNSPNNPSGACYTADEFAELAAVLEKHPNILICSDEIYEHFVFDGHKFTGILNACPQLYDRTIIINGVSKAYSMTGWRIGYAAGPPHLIAAMKKIQSQSTSNPCSISQIAAQAALQGPLDFLEDVRRDLTAQRDFLVDSLNRIDGVSVLSPPGSFYLLPDCSGALQRLDYASNDLELAEHLLEEFLVATVPGIAFGLPNHLRISFPGAFKDIQRAAERFTAALGG